MPLRYLAVIVLLALVSPFIGFCSWDRVEAWRVSSRLAAIERSGEPVRINADETDVPETAEQKRASRLYSEATRLASSAHGPRVLDAGTMITALAALPRAGAARDPRTEKLSAIEKDYARVLELLDQAAPLDVRGYAPGDRPKYVLDERYIANPNAIRIARLAFAGDSEAAARALLGTLRIRRMYPANWRRRTVLPTAHSLEVVLSSGPVTMPLLEQLQREYLAIDADLDVEQQLVSDRARFLGTRALGAIARVSGSGEIMSALRPSPFEALAYRLLQPVRRHALVAALDDYAEAIEVARLPWPAKLDATETLMRRKGGTRTGGRRSMLQQVGEPWGRNVGTYALASVTSSTAEGLARARAAASALAIARYRLDHRGELPPSLEALVPKYLPAVPQDPFSGTAMRYVRNGTAYTAYSIGANRKDDGGRWYPTSDLLPRRGNPEDLGIAVGHGGDPAR